MSDTATDKEPEEKPPQPKPELEWTLGAGTKSQLDNGWQFFTICVLLFMCWLGCFIRWGTQPMVMRGLVSCASLFFIWACVWIRRLPVKRCDPECYQCRRQG